MALELVYRRQMMFSLFDKESAFDAGPAGWTSSSACQMTDYEEAVTERWDDTVQGNADVVTGFERNTLQMIARQSVAFPYAEPRVKPNTLAGFLGLAAGSIAATQDGILDAYRHRVQPVDTVSLPSMAAQVKYHGGVQRLYTGLKAGQFTLGNNGPFWRFACDLLGSGTRSTSVTAFPAAIVEDWIKWGDAALYIKPTAGTPIDTTLATPSQSAPNLGGSEVNLSQPTIGWTWTENNSLPADDGYRPSTRLVRGNTHATRRVGTVAWRLEVDTTTEAAQLNYYLTQTKLAMELRVAGTTVIDVGSTFFPGLTVIFPQVQLTAIPRGTNNQRETLEFQCSVMEDGTNPAYVAFVYNAQPAYLA